ncbi:MAG: DUF1343 domain-containing protein [Chloroflexi bacterium]|nr:DUF1343 domain-containing protein [Chloroflexota bacterium]
MRSLAALAGTGAVQLGLEQLLATLRGKRAGLIANQASVLADFTHLGHLLHSREDLELRCFFAPEHGLWGDVQGGGSIATTNDPVTGLPIHSLFVNTPAGRLRKPTPEMLSGLDVLLCDLQDAGARYYTYISTMEQAMETAAEAGIPFVVLDRPNPIGGQRLDGNVSTEEERSFTAIHPLPVQHGMTIGELALLLNAERALGADLTVIPMCGWQRSMFFDATGLPWVAPSPNMPVPATATVYTCSLIVGANLSPGLGTTQPFELVGAPWVDPFVYASALEARHLPGVCFRPAYFFVHFGPHAQQRCGGVQLHVTERRAFRACETAAHMTVVATELYPDQAVPPLPGLSRHRIVADGRDAGAIIASWQDDLAQFRIRRAAHLLYTEDSP